jgi:hypothetical protein
MNLREKTTDYELTEWMDLKLDWDIQPWGNKTALVASFLTWLLLAGFIVFPGTFASIRTSKAFNSAEDAQAVIRAVGFIPLLGLACFCCLVATFGIIWLWWKNCYKYIWLVDRLFA